MLVPDPLTGLRDMGRAELLGKAEHNWDLKVNPFRSKQGGISSFSSAVSINDELKPPQKGIPLYLTCSSPQTQIDPLRKELRAAHLI